MVGVGGRQGTSGAPGGRTADEEGESRVRAERGAGGRARGAEQ